jgi:anti-sigma factor RsiW
MTDMRCGYAGDRDDALIAYLYDDIDAAARAAFDAHLAGCEPCRVELEALGGVRTQLARWNPPEPKSLTAANTNPYSAIRNPQWWRTIPAWAQAAAALLFLGVSAGIANLDVRYDSNGFAIRTGWLKPPQSAPAAAATAPSGGVGLASIAGQNSSAASREDLVALEQRLRTELKPATPAPAGARAASSDAEILRKVRALIDDTERRQQSELALRLAQAISDVNAARQADLRRVDLTLNRVENNLGVEVLKNRQSMQYLMRVNQRQ